MQEGTVQPGGQPSTGAMDKETSKKFVEAAALWLLCLVSIIAILVALLAFAAIRRRWIGASLRRQPPPGRLPDPWREAARRMDKPPPTSPEEEPLQ